MKKFIVRISYANYAIEQEDAVALLAIASRMKLVKQNGYNGPQYVQRDHQEPWLDTVSLEEVVELEQSDTLDKFTAATREIIPF
jgi:hypothetical protein